MKTKLVYEECIAVEAVRFAEMLANLNKAGVCYTTTRAQGLLVIEIEVGAF